jgi:nucleoside-diphosphate-sugar epimerase
MHAPSSVDALDDLISQPDEGVIEAVRRLPGEFAVLGAGGKMGYHVSLMLQRALAACGRDEPVITVSRFGTQGASDPLNAEGRKFQQAGFDVIAADLSQPEQVARLPRVPNVLFLAGVKFGTANNPDLLHRMNVTMPTLVADHFRDSRIAALSTGCVYSFCTPESGGASEESPLDPPGEYARSCLGREQAFTAASREQGTPCVLIRLNYSIDLRYGVLVDVAQKVRAGIPIHVETGYVNVIWQGDAVSQIIRSLPLAESPPLVLNVSGAEILRVRDLAEQFGDRFGIPVRIEGNEAPTAWLSNPAKAHRLFGPPRVSVERMIDWIAAWLEAGGETLDKPTHFEVRSGAY